MRRALATLLLAACAIGSPAETLVGNVVGIADGDTVTVLDSTFRQHKVRLAGIDAPERGQPFGNRSKQTLASLVFRREVYVEWHKKDRYQRLVGSVRVGQTDVGLALVGAGMAWHYRVYANEQSTEDRANYRAAENEARSSNRGLWLDPAPEAPWEYRMRRRTR